MNFVELMRIKGVATQGRQDAAQWVRAYSVRYSSDGMNFIPYKENRGVKVGDLNLYTLTSVCIISIPFSLRFP